MLCDKTIIIPRTTVGTTTNISLIKNVSTADKSLLILQQPIGLIPRQRNSSRETVYAKYGWLHVNNSIEFSLRKKKFRFASE